MNTREEYVEKAKAKLDEWNAEIDKLRAQADQASADAEIKWRGDLKTLELQRDVVKKKLEALQSSNERAWEDLKSGFESAWREMADSVGRAKQHYAS